jgi:[protein-PII] uridylyltransferase
VLQLREEPVVRARMNPVGAGLQVMIYVPDQPALFARICGFFAKLGYSIVDARIHTCRHGYALDSFILLDPENHLPYRDMIALIEHDLTENLNRLPPLAPPSRGRLSRQVRHVPLTPEVSIRIDEGGKNHILSITAADRPGLLYSTARVLGQYGLNLHTAKIVTLGERAEDVFLVSGPALASTRAVLMFEQDLLAALEQP